MNQYSDLEGRDSIMREKVSSLSRDITDGDWKEIGRAVRFLILFSLAVVCALYTITGEWNNVFYYPEKEYEVLEEAARNIINNNIFVTEDETGYKYVINNYDSETCALEMTVSEKTNRINSASTYIVVNVENCKAVDKNITIERKEKGVTKHVTNEIVVLLCYVGMLACVLALILLILGIVIDKMSKSEEREDTLEEENHSSN